MFLRGAGARGGRDFQSFLVQTDPIATLSHIILIV